MRNPTGEIWKYGVKYRYVHCHRPLIKRYEERSLQIGVREVDVFHVPNRDVANRESIC